MTNDILRDFSDIVTIVYVDYILVYSKTYKEHNMHVLTIDKTSLRLPIVGQRIKVFKIIEDTMGIFFVKIIFTIM